MPRLSLTVTDFREVVSSILMTGLSYEARMHHSSGGSLAPDFVPNAADLPAIDDHVMTIKTMFHAPEARLEQGASIDDWATALSEMWQTTHRAVTFHTSGSTGDPKAITHDFNLLEQEVMALARLFSDRRKIVSFVPRNHIYGFLFSILLPKALNVPVQWEAPLPTMGLINALRPGDLLVAFPLLWGKFRQLGIKFKTDIHGVTSTSPCPPDVIHGLKSNELARMYEIYGSSETGGVGYRTEPGGLYSLLPYWERTADDTWLERTMPDKTRRTFQLQNVMHWESGGFTPRKRTDNCVQVAGVNVYPERIQEKLRSLPGVAECAVRLMRQEEGERLKAFVVPRKDQDTTRLEADLRAWTKQHLPPTEQPAKWTFGNRLPVTAMGKDADW